MNLICAYCGINYQYHRKKQFCSTKCCRASNRRKLGIPEFKPKEDKICKHCGSTFYRNTNGVYCKPECRIEHQQEHKAKRNLEIQRLKQEKAEKDLINKLNRKLISIVKAYAKFKDKHHKECKVCSKPYIATNFGAPSNYCGKICKDTAKKEYKSSEAFKRLKRIYKAKRRAIELTNADDIDPLFIFDRDNWKCKICNVDTPIELRGSYEDDAPELDHIIPLSRGGSHTIDNVRCLCRSCNALKGNKLDNEINNLWGAW
jgi:hypothetical protein